NKPVCRDRKASKDRPDPQALRVLRDRKESRVPQARLDRKESRVPQALRVLRDRKESRVPQARRDQATGTPSATQRAISRLPMRHTPLPLIRPQQLRGYGPTLQQEPMFLLTPRLYLSWRPTITMAPRQHRICGP